MKRLVLPRVMLIAVGLGLSGPAQAQDAPLTYWRLARFERRPFDLALSSEHESSSELRRAQGAMGAGALTTIIFRHDKSLDEVTDNATARLTYSIPPTVPGEQTQFSIGAQGTFSGGRGACYGEVTHAAGWGPPRFPLDDEHRRHEVESWGFERGIRAGDTRSLVFVLGCTYYLRLELAAIYEWTVGTDEDWDADGVPNDDDVCPDSPELLSRPSDHPLRGCPPEVVDPLAPTEASTEYLERIWTRDQALADIRVLANALRAADGLEPLPPQEIAVATPVLELLVRQLARSDVSLLVWLEQTVGLFAHMTVDEALSLVGKFASPTLLATVRSLIETLGIRADLSLGRVLELARAEPALTRPDLSAE